MCNDLSYFANIKHLNNPKNKITNTVDKVDDVQLNDEIILKDVLYGSSFHFSLIFVSMLCLKGMLM